MVLLQQNFGLLLHSTGQSMARITDSVCYNKWEKKERSKSIIALGMLLVHLTDKANGLFLCKTATWKIDSLGNNWYQAPLLPFVKIKGAALLEPSTVQDGQIKRFIFMLTSVSILEEQLQDHK